MAFVVQDRWEKRLQIGAEQIIRPLSFGNEWAKVRIGVRFSVWPTGTQLAAGNLLLFGLCRGSVGFADTNCVDFIGMAPGGSGGPSGQPWAYTATPAPGTYSLSGCQGYLVRRQGGVVTWATAGGNLTVGWGCAPVFNSVHLIDLTRTNTLLTVSNWHTNSTNSLQNNSVSGFFTAMENESTPGSIATSQATGGTLALTSWPVWDSVCFSWNRCFPTVEVYQIAVTRFL